MDLDFGEQLFEQGCGVGGRVGVGGHRAGAVGDDLGALGNPGREHGHVIIKLLYYNMQGQQGQW